MTPRQSTPSGGHGGLPWEKFLALPRWWTIAQRFYPNHELTSQASHGCKELDGGGQCEANCEGAAIRS